MKQSTKVSRKFLGKLTDFASPQERAFEKKHLKAYIRGHQFFTFGFKEEQLGEFKMRVPAYFPVQQSLINE